MSVFPWKCLFASVAVAITAAAFAQERVARRSPDRATPASPERRLSDYHLAAWVILENDVQVRVSRFVQGIGDDKRVRRFAERMADSDRDLIAALHGPLPGADRRDGAFDAGRVLQDIADRLAKVQASRPAAPEDSGAKSQTAQEPAKHRDTGDATAPATQHAEHQRGQSRQERQDLREQRRDELRGLAGDRDRKGAIAEVGPVIRDNLPLILDTLGDAIQRSGAQTIGMSFIELRREITRKFADSMIHELEGRRGQGFDQAYLDFEIASHLKLINTMEAIKTQASADLSGAIDRHLATVNKQLQEARDLVHEVK